MSPKRLVHSFWYAWRGIVHVANTEQSFQVQLVAAVAVIGAAIFFQIRMVEWLVVVLVTTSLLVLELLNSTVERMVDLFKPRLHDQVEVIKDSMAGAVFLAACGAFAIGCMIFAPYVWQMMNGI